MSKKIIVNMSGWCEADPTRTMFQYIGQKDDAEQLIGGTQWLSLPEYDEKELCRKDYVLENVVTAFKHSLDGDYEHIDVAVEEDIIV